VTYINTLRHRLAYVGTVLPNTLLEATNHAVDVGAVVTTRGGIPYRDTLQEVTACKPELLEVPASFSLTRRKEKARSLISSCSSLLWRAGP
jgi:hypothetical protein